MPPQTRRHIENAKSRYCDITKLQEWLKMSTSLFVILRSSTSTKINKRT